MIYPKAFRIVATVIYFLLDILSTFVIALIGAAIYKYAVAVSLFTYWDLVLIIMMVYLAIAGIYATWQDAKENYTGFLLVSRA